jgi:PAS domain S-box-containing protein
MSATGKPGLGRQTLRAAITTAAVLAGLLLRQILVLHFGFEMPAFITFYPAVMVVALLFGLWFGLLATALSAALAAVWVFPPAGQFRIARTGDIVALALFFGMGVFMSVVAERYRRNERRIAAFEKEEALRATRAKLEAALASMSDAVFISDAEGRFLEFNDAFAAYYRFKSKAECAGTIAELPAFLEVFMANGEPAPLEMWAATRALRGETVTNAEYTLRRKDTGETWIGSYNFSPIRDRNGAIAGSVVTARDITERKRQEARLRRFYETDLFAILYWKIDGGVVDVNDRFLKMTGYTREDVRAGIVNWARMTPPEYQALDEDARRQVMETGVHLPYEKEFIRKDGVRVWGQFWAAAYEDDRTQGVSFILDITEHKRAEQALLRNEKLASVGRMAAAMAHEINNPLAAVTNVLFLAQDIEGLPEPARQYLETADAELKRIAHIAQQSLGFYRESNTPEIVSVNRVLDSAVELMKSKITARRARIVKEWDGEVKATAVAGELRQVFSNLLANSLDAIGEEGTIRLRVSAGTDFKTGRRSVRVTVADNGKGISAGARQHIFEPFFTTKGSVGTGLGLWVTRQIVDKHRGTIRMRSCTGGAHRGTVFSVVLPADPV